MTQLGSAKNRRVTGLIKKIAALEGIKAGSLLSRVASGECVIPANKYHRIISPCGIGKGLSTKINANIGTSTDNPDTGEEIRKLKAAVKYGAHTVMDLSVGGNLDSILDRVIAESPVPVGTVPIYEIAVKAKRRYGNSLSFGAEDVISCLERQAQAGVDFFTIHAGVTRKSISALNKSRRLMGIVSRGGAILAAWMKLHGAENPFFTEFDRILAIAEEYDVTLSLGDGLRPGSIQDATDGAQIAELKILGELARRAYRHNVQVMIEGPGHVPLNEVAGNMALQKKICRGAPFYVLGPLVTDVAAGYDHISGAIGGAIAASAGADFLCYVTPAEHLRHPDIKDVREGVVASRIAAHAADIVKGVKGARNWDVMMSRARRSRDWKRQIELSIDPEKAGEYRRSSKPHLSDVCTMCGEYCSIKLMDSCVKD